MKLLVFGGSGFIGKNFIRYWSQRTDWQIVAIYHKNVKLSQFCAGLPNVAVISSEEAFSKQTIEECDSCLYLAGNSNHTVAFDNPIFDIEQSTLPLLQLLHKFKGRLVYLSSGAVYYGLKGQVSPDTPVHPTFPYAVSRLANESYIKSFYERGSLKEYLIIRFYYAFGPYEHSRRLIPRLIKHFFTCPDKPFPVNGDGKTLLAPLYVEDVCDGLGKIVQNRLHCKVLDFCAPAPISLLDLVNKVASTLEITPKWEFCDSKERPIEFWSSPNEILSIYNLKDPIPLDQGIKKYVNWIRITL
ncbi:MAG: NAD-dependent epimerase/dehydratase family protein [Candidatus Aminicenantaceae bacterium]